MTVNQVEAGVRGDAPNDRLIVRIQPANPFSRFRE